MKLLTYENIPCWYELSWLAEPPTIVLRLHRDFIAVAKIMSPEAFIVQKFMKEFRFTNWNGDFTRNWGFEDAFVRQGEKDEFVEFWVSIPKVKWRTAEPCEHCNGSGKNPLFEDEDEKCFSCDGSGKAYTMDWKTAYAISASFTVFSNLADHPEQETRAAVPQLLTVRTITRQESHGGSLGGEYSVPLARWMASLGDGTKMTEMVEAMKAAHYRLFDDEKFDLHRSSFRASIDYEDGWLNVSCPGEACGLNPEHGEDIAMREKRGYKFDCHNVDTPMQQLTLLAGLVALHDRARRELGK